MTFDTDLITPYTAEQIVNVWIKAQEDIRQGFALLEGARDDLKAAMGRYDRHSNMDPLDDRYNRYDFRQDGDTRVERTINGIKRSVWATILNGINVKRTMSIKAAKALDEQLETGELPDVTVANIFHMLQSLVQNSTAMMNELMKEAMEELYPKIWNPNKWNPEYVTNIKHAKGEHTTDRVILRYAVEQKWNNGGFTVRYRNMDRIRVIDRAFHLLDGKSMPDTWQSPLSLSIEQSEDGYGETDYFHFRACKNGNLHLTFKRTDLLHRLVRMARQVNSGA